MKKSKGYLMMLVLLTGGFWGLSFVSMDYLVDRMSPMQALACRWTVAAVIFLILIALRVIKIDLKSKALKYLVIGAVLQPCIYSVLEIYGIKFTSVSVSSVLIAASPAMTLLVGMLFFRRKPSKIGIIGIITAFAGVVIFNVFAPGASAEGSLKGYIILIAAITVLGFFGFIAGKAAEGFSAIERTAVMAVFGAVTFNIACIFMGFGTETYTMIFSDAKTLIAVLFLGVICTVVCYSSYNALLASMEPATAANLVSCLTTVMGVVTGIIIAGDSFGWYTWAGTIVTLAGIILSSRSIE